MFFWKKKKLKKAQTELYQDLESGDQGPVEDDDSQISIDKTPRKIKLEESNELNLNSKSVNSPIIGKDIAGDTDEKPLKKASNLNSKISPSKSKTKNTSTLKKSQNSKSPSKPAASNALNKPKASQKSKSKAKSFKAISSTKSKKS